MSQTLAGMSLALLIAVGGSGAVQIPNPEGSKDPLKPAKIRHLYGKVVRVDAEEGTLLIRVGRAELAKDQEYLVTKATRYWGPDREQLGNGLHFPGFKQGAEVWFLLGNGERPHDITELRLFDPELPTRRPAVQLPPKPGR
jgi:hypothetical protein